MRGLFVELLIAEWHVVGFACHGSQTVCDVRFCDEEAATVGVPVDGQGVVSRGLELVGAVDDSNGRAYWAEIFVQSIQRECDFLPVISILLVAPFNGDVANLSASSCVAGREDGAAVVEEHKVCSSEGLGFVCRPTRQGVACALIGCLCGCELGLPSRLCSLGW